MRFFASFWVVLSLGACASQSVRESSTGPRPDAENNRITPTLQYPETRRDAVVEELHGTTIADPYRWLEDDNAPETEAWVQRQNAVTTAFLEPIPSRAPLRERLTELWNFERLSPPRNLGGRFFFSRNDGLQNQSVLFWTNDLETPPTVLLDPNTLSEDGTVALSSYGISRDGQKMVYGLSNAGSDWIELRVKNVVTGVDEADRLRWVKFVYLRDAWAPDGRGFYYARYPEPKAGDALKGQNLNQALYYHRLGDPQGQDRLVFQAPDAPKHFYSTRVSDDGRYLLLITGQGTDPTNLVHWAPIKKGREGTFTPLISEWIGSFDFIGNEGPVFWFKTNHQAPRGRVIAIDIRNPEPARWREVIPETKNTLTDVSLVGDRFIANYLADAKTQVTLYSLAGQPVTDVDLPGIGTARGFAGKLNHQETFYYFTGFNTPGSIYRYDIKAQKSTLFQSPKVRFDPNAFTTEQVFFTSKDGTRIPMFISYKKGLRRDGTNPTLLYGYGGFNIPLTPAFRVASLAWMEQGGIYAVANLRGGGEYGRAWHEAGRLANKQNVFDDFIAAAEYLIAKNYTSSPKLAIQGGSNGGLLVGAAITQRPDLFGAAIPQVGVLDMLRFHKFTIGWAWIDDYGSPDDPKAFATLRAYSPYHNLQPGTAYPATLIITADHDDRVVPAHSFKFAAALQHAHRGENPVLIRIETRAGHGRGKPTTLRIAEATDILAFLTKALKMSPP